MNWWWRFGLVKLAAIILGLLLSLAVGLPHDAYATRLSEVKKLEAPPEDEGENFGASVDLSADDVIVGASGEAAYIYARNEGGAGNWGLVKKLLPPSAGNFGTSVAIDGDTAIVGNGAAEAAYVFQRDAGGPDNWGFVKELMANDNEFGWHLALQGDLAVVSALTCCSNAGAAYVFERDWGGTDNWGEVKKIVGSATDTFDQFGFSVDVDVDTIVAGAQNAEFGGEVYVFQQDHGGPDNWGEVARLLKPEFSDAERFGSRASLDGDTLIVGPSYASGVAFAYERDAGGIDNWGNTHEFLSPSPQKFTSGSLSGDTVLLVGIGLGGVIYQKDPGEAGAWLEANVVLEPSAISNAAGFGTAIDGDTAVLSQALANPEAAWVFTGFKGTVGGIASLPPVELPSDHNASVRWLLILALTFVAAAALALARLRRARAA